MGRLVLILSFLWCHVAYSTNSCRAILGDSSFSIVSITDKHEAPHQCGKSCYFESTVTSAEMWANKTLGLSIQLSRSSLAYLLLKDRVAHKIEFTELVSLIYELRQNDNDPNLIDSGRASQVIKLLNKYGWPVVPKTSIDQEAEDIKVEMLIGRVQDAFDIFKEKIVLETQGMKVRAAIEEKHSQLQIFINELNQELSAIERDLNAQPLLQTLNLPKVSIRDRVKVETSQGRRFKSERKTYSIKELTITNLQNLKRFIDRGIPMLVSYKHVHGFEIISLESILKGRPEARGGSGRMGNHSAVIIGYIADSSGKIQYFKILNSWGQQFGEQGAFYISIDQLAENIKSASTLELD